MTNVIPMRIRAEALAVETRGLVKRYGRNVALNGVDLTVPEGAFYVLVGPNGAGKSTTLRILLDLVSPNAGEARVFGRPSADVLVRAQIGYVPEKHDETYTWMRVNRLLAHHAAYFPSWDNDYAAQLVRKLDVKVDRKFGRLSKGEARRVQLVMALAHRPALLLLDEPTDGLDPLARETVLGLLAEHIADSPTTVLASTHLIYEMERLADHIGVLRNGFLAAQIKRDELHDQLRHYVLEVPDGWVGATDLGRAVVRKNGGAREVRWTVWGEERDITTRIAAAGARVRDVQPVSLEDAALALLSREG
jgi:ABC-2 type transport system ATP-binding protein